MLRTRGEKIFEVFNVLYMLVLCLVTLYPVWHVAMASFSDPNVLYVDHGFYLWPKGETTLHGYQLVLENPNIITGFINTIFYLVAGSIGCMFITIMGAYTLSRKGVYWNKWIMKGIIITMYFQGGLIPFYIQMKNMNLLDSPLAILLPLLMNTWNLIVLRTAFAGVPDSLIESAKLDAASDWRILWQIVVPVSKATIAVITLFYAVRFWNEWFYPSLFLSSKDKWPLQLVLREILLKNNTNSMTQMSAVGQTGVERYRILVKYCTIIVATVPIFIVYPLVQKYFVAGVMVGSVKG